MSTSTFTHMVRYPPLTDLVEFLGAYKLLFESMGIGSNMDVEYCESFSHPVPEENEKLTEDYVMTYTTFQFIFADVGNSLTNTGVTVNQYFAIFVFSYEV
jgi:hypothetical protein